MHELIVNLHMHTRYSDGAGTHADLGQAALKTNVDVLLVTDHNTWVQGVDAYYRAGKRRVLLLAGEEIHDQGRDPQKNHLLAFETKRELAHLAHDPQNLVDAIRRSGGLCFIAHPVDPAMPAFGETDISWEAWNVAGFTGIELWNGFSELKAVAKGKLEAILYAFFPETIPHGPLPETLTIWDSLLAKRRRIVAIGGSDAHARPASLGPIHRIVFPYEYHFSTINTHVLTPAPLSGDMSKDRKMIFAALAGGRCFVGYDLPAPTKGFRFSARGRESTAIMGDEISLDNTVTLQAKFPSKTEIRLLKDGKCIQTSRSETLVHVTEQPGVFRIEAYINFLGKRRGWIFSNPIYVR